MAGKSLAARRKEIGRQAANIKMVMASNNFSKKEKDIFLFGYLHALLSNKNTADVVYQIAIIRGSLEELERFAAGR
jgi:hypothetical protein